MSEGKTIGVEKVNYNNVDINIRQAESSERNENEDDTFGLNLLANINKINDNVVQEKSHKNDEIDVPLTFNNIDELIEQNDNAGQSYKEPISPRKQESYKKPESPKKESYHFDNFNFQSNHDKHLSRSSSPVSVRSHKFEEKPRTFEDVLNEKKDLLHEFEKLKRRGVKFTKNYTMADNLDEMKYEYETLKKNKETENGVKFARKMLMACITGIEFLNNRFDPFDINLDGWSESIHENIDDYDDVFEELHEKYKGSVDMAPELKLIMMVAGSGFMFHLTNNMFKSSMPQFENVMKQNPNVVDGMMGGMMGNMMNMFNQPTGQTSAPGPSMSAPPPSQSPIRTSINKSNDRQMPPNMSEIDVEPKSSINDNKIYATNKTPISKPVNKTPIPSMKKDIQGPQGIETLLQSLATNSPTGDSSSGRRRHKKIIK
tara:strand:+ start:1087 stop:2376 length:1290 start_codon:yes stop_codon:yes gene_type:complete